MLSSCLSAKGISAVLSVTIRMFVTGLTPFHEFTPLLMIFFTQRKTGTHTKAVRQDEAQFLFRDKPLE